jgi:raffinose synthase
MTESRAADGTLVLGGATLFDSSQAELTPLASGQSGFLSARFEPAARHRLRLGGCATLKRLLASYRYEPFWMKPCVGTSFAAVPADTQFLLLELESGQVAVIAPLVQAPFKVTLQGEGDELWAVLDSGDPAVLGDSALLAYVAVGDDPYQLCRDGARAVAERLGTFRVRRDKALPKLCDWFGWCTWDAFYQEVSYEKVRQGLASFRAGGVEPRLLILDDGWQTVRKLDTGAARLAAFAANEKFPGGVAATVALAKLEYGVRSVVVWHAVHGYWGGIDAESLPAYGVEPAARSYSEEVLAHGPKWNDQYWGPVVGRPARAQLGAFYSDYHQYLASQGVDGVKVDNQASVECLGAGQGGRVGIMAATRRALEHSTRTHFQGELINCMSCSSEMLYGALDSSLTRTSTDFWPNIPASHGQHIYANAVVGLWFGELVHPDWDMFQSGHQAGAFHAAARAVSGSPIYVSDKPGEHDFELLKRLVLSDGRALRALDVGVPTRDSLFVDPTTEAALFKVVNRNPCGWVLGVFNTRHVEGDNLLSGSLRVADVPGISGDDFAVYLQRSGQLLRVTRDQAVPLQLDSLEAEVATLVLLDGGVGALGLADKLNSGAAVLSAGWDGGVYVIQLADGGNFLAYSAIQPSRVEVDGSLSPYAWSAGRLTLAVSGAGQREVRLCF